MNEMPVRTTVSPRPAHVPAAWPIFNAPRPLCGTVTWTGEFLTGIFYAAVDPADPAAAAFIAHNRRDAAVVVEYVAAADLIAAHKAELLARYGEAVRADLDAPDAAAWLLRHALARRNGD